MNAYFFSIWISISNHIDKVWAIEGNFIEQLKRIIILNIEMVAQKYIVSDVASFLQQNNSYV